MFDCTIRKLLRSERNKVGRGNDWPNWHFWNFWKSNTSGELRFGLGVDDDSFYDAYGDYIETEIDHYFGAYLKFSASSEKISPYAIIGLTKVKATVYDSYYEYSESDSDDDFSYGVGVDFANGFFLEYIQYLDKSGLELNGLSLGMKFWVWF